jgi:hypothetical protein
MGRARGKATLGGLFPNRLQTIERRPRAIEQTLDARFSMARKPFLAGLPAHPVWREAKRNGF